MMNLLQQAHNWTSSRENLSAGFPKNTSFKSVSSATQTDWKIEISPVARLHTLHKAKNKDADQTARMRRLVCACVVRKPPKTGFLATRPIIILSAIYSRYYFSDLNDKTMAHFQCHLNYVILITDAKHLSYFANWILSLINCFNLHLPYTWYI